MSSHIIALLTDFGYTDPFVGMMKGVILGIDPQARLIDLTHQIEPGDIVGGALALKQSLAYFPPGTVFLGVVDPGVGSGRAPVLVESGERFLVGPDNGLFYPAVEGAEFSVWRLDNPVYHLPRVSSTFHGRDIFAPVSAHLSRGVPPKELGSSLPGLLRLELPQPEREGNLLKGEVIQVDRFGNLLTNLTEADLGGEKIKTIRVRGVEIAGLSSHYSQVPPGGLLALMSSFSRLEIAANQGSAASILKAARGSKLEVEFKNRSSLKK